MQNCLLVSMASIRVSPTAAGKNEFGVRLLKADVSFVLAAEAVGYHYEHETNSLDRSIIKKEYFRGWPYILTNGLGLLENY